MKNQENVMPPEGHNNLVTDLNNMKFYNLSDKWIQNSCFKEINKTKSWVF